MKKLVLTCLAAALVPVASFAQGTINFNSSAPATQYILESDGTTRAATGTPAWLFFSPTQSGIYSMIASNAVTVNGWLTTSVVATTPAAADGGIAGGTEGWFYIMAQNLAGTFYGETPVFSLVTGNPQGSPPTNPTLLTGYWTAPIAMTIPVPEPTTLALAGLGAAALMIFRRRRQ